MDIKYLAGFLATIEAGSLNRASARLGISQPALTKNIQRLEALLGAPLFVREAKGMRATIYAEALKDFAQATCVGLEQSINEIRALKDGSSGTTVLCGPPLIANYLFPDVVLHVASDFPSLELKIVEQIDDLFDSLQQGKFDLLTATITSEAIRYGLSCMSLFDEDLVIIAKPGHPVTRFKSPTARQLAKYKWILSSTGNLHRRKLEQFFEASNVPMPRPLAETSSPSMIKALVLKSDCIALMAKMGAKSELDAGELDSVKLNSPLMSRSIGLLWRSNHIPSAATERVIDAIKAVCEQRGHKPRLLVDRGK